MRQLPEAIFGFPQDPSLYTGYDSYELGFPGR